MRGELAERFKRLQAMSRYGDIENPQTRVQPASMALVTQGEDQAPDVEMTDELPDSKPELRLANNLTVGMENGGRIIVGPDALGPGQAGLVAYSASGNRTVSIEAATGKLRGYDASNLLRMMIDDQYISFYGPDGVTARGNISGFDSSTGHTLFTDGGVSLGPNVTGTHGIWLAGNTQVDGNLDVDGSITLPAWTAYNPTWGSSANPQPAIGDGTLVGRYCQIGKQVTAVVNLTIGSTTTMGTTFWEMSLPVTPKATVIETGSWLAYDSNVTTYYGGPIRRLATVATPGMRCAINAGTFITPTTPMTWAQNDKLEMTLIYEAS